jgi:hypothetical protein
MDREDRPYHGVKKVVLYDFENADDDFKDSTKDFN